MKYFKIEDEIKYYKMRYELERDIEDMFLKKGYTHIELPVFEEMGNCGIAEKRTNQESLVKVLSGFGDVLALRYDNTTSIIQNIVPKWEEEMELKLFYNSMVYRNDTRTGAQEIKQLGVEYLGDSGLDGDVEVTLLALNILEKFNEEFVLEFSNSKYIRGLFQAMKLDGIQEKKLKDLIYRKNKFEILEYAKTLDLDKEIEDCLINIFDFQGDISKVAGNAKKYYMNDTMKEALKEIMVLKDYVLKNGYSKRIHFDLSMVTELSYYDGIIFKGYYPNVFSEIISGGRYDAFTVVFGEKIPALGFSLDLSALTDIYFRGMGKQNGLY